VVIWGVDLKGGMELQPWAACIGRLATTSGQATGLFKDAVTELERRAAQMAGQGKRAWEPAPHEPALVIVMDEYAEMPEEAHEYADSVARLGRAVAVSLIAATQRPSQQAMGKGAVRSQMDIRICLRVRERRDVDLILGQGALNAGWHAHQLTQPGAFLISSPEHTTPERHRAYLITDDQIARHAAQHAHVWPALAAGGLDMPQPPTRSPQTAGNGPHHGDSGNAPDRPETALWAALLNAGPDGLLITDLMTACGMGRSWVYYRLREHSRAGRAVQTTRGSWRAARPSDARPSAR
jgi:S-DNA-T family DNA segregation ATPase FtsK/SpoIIIE